MDSLDLKTLEQQRRAALRARATDLRPAAPAEPPLTAGPNYYINRVAPAPKRRSTKKLLVGLPALTLLIISGLLVAPHAGKVAATVTETVHNVSGALTSNGDSPGKDQAVATPAVGRLIISSQNISAPIIWVGLTSGGKLDSPKALNQIGLYSGGPKPGQSGTAVVDGHYGVGRDAGALRRLDQVNVGDLIEYQDTLGPRASFKVVSTQTYPVGDEADAKLFGTGKGPLLNLVACAGSWDGTDYSERLIVSAELVN